MRIKAKNNQGGWDTYCPHGIGDILETNNPTSPAERWPGTVWAAMGAGRVLVGVDPSDADFDAPGKVGGTKEHKLLSMELPSHVHPVGVLTAGSRVYNNPPAGSSSALVVPQPWSWNSAVNTSSEERRIVAVAQEGLANQPHQNMPPYETVYRYKRTA